ncbi:MAG: SRPBCC domain-containing protein [Chloroflexi bacterium]|nr:SRPBCC domain-containing protein [Chloroflexota bacterium]
MDSFKISAVLPAKPERVYRAWLDSVEHSEFTGGHAEVDPKVGGKFTAWDGYIRGTTVELQPEKRIVQQWRTTEFPESSPDSRLEVLLEPMPRGARITLEHTDIPEGQGPQYKKGWRDYYFKPMRKYFAER